MKKTSELLDREAPNDSNNVMMIMMSNNVPQVGTSPVLATKQEPSKLVMPALEAVHNQQFSAAMQRSHKASVYDTMAVDESQLQGVSLTRVLFPLLSLGQDQTPPRF